MIKQIYFTETSTSMQCKKTQNTMLEQTQEKQTQ